MPRSHSRRRRYTPPPRPRPKPSPPWLGRTIVLSLLVGLVYLLLTYMQLLPWQGLLGGYDLVIGFALIAVALLLALRWR